MTDEEFLKVLGARIRELRTEKGLSQDELASRLGTKHTQVGRIERGEVNSSINMLRRIAGELGVELGELIKSK